MVMQCRARICHGDFAPEGLRLVVSLEDFEGGEEE